MKIHKLRKLLFALLIAAATVCAFSLCACEGQPQVKAADMEVFGAPVGEYAIGAQFDPSALSVIVRFDDGSEKKIEYSENGEISFSGWDTDSEGGRTFVVRCMGLEKKFEYSVRNVMITLMLNGGELELSGEVIKDRYSFVVASGIADLTGYHPKKSDEKGYAMSFAGWYTDAECTTRAATVLDSLTLTDDTTLYAGYDTDWSWMFKYTISVNAVTNQTEVTLDGFNGFEYGNDERYLEMGTVLTIPSTVEGYPVTALGKKFSKLIMPEFPDMDISVFQMLNFDTVTFRDDSPLREIGNEAFINESKNSITTFVFPKNLKVIGEKAFSNTMITAEKLVLPASLEKIMAEAFCSAYYDEISFEEGSKLKSIGDKAFMASEMTKITLPEGLQEIGKYAFSGCPYVTHMRIPSTVSNIGLYAFNSMNALEEIRVDVNNAAYWSDANGNLYQYGETAGEAYLVRYCNANRNTEFTLPAKDLYDNDIKITRILEAAFSVKDFSVSGNNNGYSYLEKINLTEGLKLIGDKAFAGISAQFTLPASLIDIGAMAFYDWEGVEFKLAEGNNNFSVSDGVLYSADGRQILCVPKNYPVEKGMFTLNKDVEVVKSYAFCKNATIEYLVFPSDGNLKKVESNGLCIYSMPMLKGVYLLCDVFEVQNDAFFDLSYVNQSVMMFASDINAYKNDAGWKNYKETNTAYGVPKALLDRVCSFDAKVIADFIGGDSVKFVTIDQFDPDAELPSGIESSIYEIHYALEKLNALFNIDEGENAVSEAYMQYFSAFEQFAYGYIAAYFQNMEAKQLLQYISVQEIDILRDCVAGYQNVLPPDIKTLVKESYAYLSEKKVFVDDLSVNRAQAIKDVMNFQLSEENLDNENSPFSFADLQKILDECEACNISYGPTNDSFDQKIRTLQMTRTMYLLMNAASMEDTVMLLAEVEYGAAEYGKYRMRSLYRYDNIDFVKCNALIWLAVGLYDSYGSICGGNVVDLRRIMFDGNYFNDIFYLNFDTPVEEYLNNLLSASQIEGLQGLDKYHEIKAKYNGKVSDIAQKAQEFQFSVENMADETSQYSYDALNTLINDWYEYDMQNAAVGKALLDKFQMLDCNFALYSLKNNRPITNDNIYDFVAWVGTVERCASEFTDGQMAQLEGWDDFDRLKDIVYCNFLLLSLKDSYDYFGINKDNIQDLRNIMFRGGFEATLPDYSAMTFENSVEYYLETVFTTEESRAELVGLEDYAAIRKQLEETCGALMSQVNGFVFSTENMADAASQYSYDALNTLINQWYEYDMQSMADETTYNNFVLLDCNFALYNLANRQIDSSNISDYMVWVKNVEYYLENFTAGQTEKLQNLDGFAAAKDIVCCNYLMNSLDILYMAADWIGWDISSAQAIIDKGGYVDYSLNYTFENSVEYYLEKVFTTAESRTELVFMDAYQTAKSDFESYMSEQK